MMIDELLSRLDGVRQRGARWSAKCPAHADKNPSLSISKGERGILMKCWGGCSLKDICSARGIREADLFFDALDTNPRRRKAAAQERDRKRKALEHDAYQQGALIDALREADYFVRSRQGIAISGWSPEKLNDELNALADAHHLLESEGSYG